MAAKVMLNVTRKEMVMVGLFIVLLALYVAYGTSCFRTPAMRIEHTVRPSIQRASPRDPAGKARTIYVTSFAFDREYPLTSIAVFRAQDLAAGNRSPLWHLVGRTEPTRSLVYGSAPSGMKPYLAGTAAEPLEPNVTYRLVAEAGGIRGEHDFTITAEAAGR